MYNYNIDQFSSVQLLSHVWLFTTPWTAACQPSLSITNPQSLLKLMSIETAMPSNHLILCCPLHLLPSIFPSIRVFSSSLHQVAKLSEFQLQHQSFHWNFRTDFPQDWLVGSLAVQETLRSLQHHSSKASILQHSALFMVQLSHSYMTTEKKSQLWLDGTLLIKQCLYFSICCLGWS